VSRSNLDTEGSFVRYPLLGALNNSFVTKILIAVFTYVAVFLIVLTVVSPNGYNLEIGDIPDMPIAATRDIEDEITTQNRVEEAKAAVLPVFVLMENIESQVLSEVNGIFDEFTHIRELVRQKTKEMEDPTASEQEVPPEDSTTQDDTAEDTATQDAATQEALPPEIEITDVLDEPFLFEMQTLLRIQLSDEELITSIATEQPVLDELKNHISRAISETMALRIKPENLLEAQSALREEMMRLPLSNEVRLLGATIGVSVIRPNMVYDEMATESEKNRAAERVERVIYRKGQYIAQAGQPITERQIILLRQLGLLDQVNISLLLGIGVVLLVIYIMVIMYLLYFEKELYEQPPLLLMISLIACLMLGLGYVTSVINPYLVPFAMGGMLITVLLHAKVAVVINIALGLVLGLMLGGQLHTVTVAMVTGMLGIYMANKLQTRNNLVWLGIGLGASSMLLIWGIELAMAGNLLTALQTSVWGLGSGMLAAVLTVGTLPIWENLFGIITPVRLVELSNPNTPILKRMLTEAPGTYHHCIIVANLAESAADAIGANGLLARVGAYYHDIGKLKRPHYFKENMISSENPHDKIDPSFSTNIITSHTKEGLELAKKYRVPRVLHDFISSHHGTSPVTYFYHKAKTTNNKDAKLDTFRHRGPKPKTPEVAIVMLADTVEAAVRALPEPTPAKVETLIRKLIKEKLEDGQLDECHLTLKNIDSIANAFTNVICGIFHERVEYPEVNLKEEESKIDDPGY